MITEEKAMASVNLERRKHLRFSVDCRLNIGESIFPRAVLAERKISTKAE